MPYANIHDLPDTIRKNLPAHAQEIFLEAFNRAWQEYEDINKRRFIETLEEAAYRVAWSAVKRKYHKRGGKWVPSDR